MFIDEVKIYVKAGNGGDGCRSFSARRGVRYRGKASGGDGGKGGDIIIRSRDNLFSLSPFQNRRYFNAPDGGRGGKNHKKGKEGESLILGVPVGTRIIDDKGTLLRELRCNNEELVLVKGGKPGRGNRLGFPVTPGSPGEKRQLLLELRLIADVGVIGFPNTGKSLLLSRLTHARPKIADFAFTTKCPVLGVLENDSRNLSLLEVPALISGSHKGRGLGNKFLRHLLNCKLLLHLIDMASVEGRDPIEDYAILNEELKSYDKNLERIPQLVVANKMDIKEAAYNLKRFKIRLRCSTFPASALKEEGLEEIIEALRERF